jgi:hypothetical protein
VAEQTTQAVVLGVLVAVEQAQTLELRQKSAALRIQAAAAVVAAAQILLVVVLLAVRGLLSFGTQSNWGGK